MHWFLMIPLCVGTMTVLQGVLNRQMGLLMGLSSAVLLNSFVVLGLAFALHFVARQMPGVLPAMFEGECDMSKFTWWMLAPGAFGFCIIAGIPWAISKLGAAKVFVAMVVAQIVVSIAWDVMFEKKPLSMWRLSGAAMAVIGVVLVSVDRS